MSRVTSDKTGRKTLAVSALIFDSKCESILMVRKRPDKNPEGQCGGWGIPTGGVEATEMAKMTIIRETESESGYPVQRVIGLLGEYPKGPLHTLLLYLVEVEDFPQAIKERDEIIEARFVPLSEMLQMPYADRKTPQGVYLSVVNRVMDALGTLASTEPEELEDGSEDAAFKPWLRENQELLRAVVGKLTKKGLLVPASA